MRPGAYTRAALLAAVMMGLATRHVARADEPAIPAPRGFVSDFAHALDPATASHLAAVIGELKEKTGAEIAVVTVDSTQPLSVFDYAMQIAERWKPGANGKNNGVVFLVAVKDRKLHIVAGYGIEGALPDGRVGEIRDTVILPRFRQGDFAGGIRAGTEAMAAIIANEYQVTLTGVPPAPALRPRTTSLPLPLLLIVVFVVLMLLTRTGLWPLLFLRGSGGGFYGGSFGGGGFGGSSGGFGGFGGGDFGGGGAGGSW